jgi:acyl-coenzyme A synthetase/AMP-(fatty) acid ligase
VVRLLDDAGRTVPTGSCGRIFVGNAAQFEGYTGGGTNQRIGGLMSSGDLGHFDKTGRLFIDGRADDMIVSGGENVFPTEVEELLAAHPAVREAAVVGIPDEQFGQRLRAFVVLREGRRLSEDAGTRCRGTWCSWTHCRAPRRERCSGGCSPNTEPASGEPPVRDPDRGRASAVRSIVVTGPSTSR